MTTIAAWPHEVLITGAAGKIGRVLREGLAGRYRLRLLDRADLGDARPGEALVQADISDQAAIDAAVRGVDAIVHLAGVARIGDWRAILPANIAATYDLLEAARRHGVRRFVYASSHHAVGFYGRDEVIDEGAFPRPDCGYGLSKAFGEAACRLYHDKFGLEAACLRIGTMSEAPYDRRTLSTWISPRDMVQITAVALETPDLAYEIVYGVSANSRSWWRNDRAEALGYRPDDSADAFAEAILAKPDEEDAVARRFQGASFAASEFMER
ncbi:MULTISPECIES: NAD(P)-dependent oxidoreductase [unclassified Chelatococcus]|uniref:NAD-dependent epimerase/dehydratase family protein n=1 Tax=unclassified Chelatococcus TaxID=2638111 RepID=UPI001BCEC028|nr:MULTISPECIES: NAD(P)-dependent oxidoreductase [unclassified Chelatococcus]MBS7698544.1 NAD(P)-dependent oxidoreductase [Chelatococcus sp. YT9]MBX3554805.1 NAD(P)-dependent oxidoreductase [Chelatococcus sp.]